MLRRVKGYRWNVELLLLWNIKRLTWTLFYVSLKLHSLFMVETFTAAAFFQTAKTLTVFA
jgi:hypothetical protein